MNHVFGKLDRGHVLYAEYLNGHSGEILRGGWGVSVPFPVAGVNG